MHRSLRISRSGTIDRITGLYNSRKTGSLKLVFRDGTYVSVPSQYKNKFIIMLTDLSGAKIDKGDLQRRIRGQRIVYCMTEGQVLCGFTPYDQWKGPEIPDGEFLVDTDNACCGGWGSVKPEIIPHDQLKLF